MYHELNYMYKNFLEDYHAIPYSSTYYSITVSCVHPRMRGHTFTSTLHLAVCWLLGLWAIKKSWPKYIMYHWVMLTTNIWGIGSLHVPICSPLHLNKGLVSFIWHNNDIGHHQLEDYFWTWTTNLGSLCRPCLRTDTVHKSTRDDTSLFQPLIAITKIENISYMFEICVCHHFWDYERCMLQLYNISYT